MKAYTLTTTDGALWRKIVPLDLCVTASVEYLRICEQQTKWPARLFVIEDQNQPLLAYPYLLRATEPDALGANAADICTTEYRGPLWLAQSTPNRERFKELFDSHCRQQRIIAEFAHLNPWSAPHELLEKEGLRTDREIVYVDLTLTEEEIWARSLCSDARRQTRQGRRSGVQVRRAENAKDIWLFYQLYTETMDRHRAQTRYYFSYDYFLAFFETMAANAFFVLAEYEGRLVAGGLYFHDSTDLYWHLSAADRKFAFLRPVNVYLYETIIRSLGKGQERMILGGGYARNDGVFHFKAQFSPLRAPFYTYRRVHDEQAYNTLMQEWSARHAHAQAPDYFPGYRATPRAC